MAKKKSKTESVKATFECVKTGRKAILTIDMKDDGATLNVTFEPEVKPDSPALYIACAGMVIDRFTAMSEE